MQNDLIDGWVDDESSQIHDLEGSFIMVDDTPMIRCRGLRIARLPGLRDAGKEVVGDDNVDGDETWYMLIVFERMSGWTVVVATAR